MGGNNIGSGSNISGGSVSGRSSSIKGCGCTRGRISSNINSSGRSVSGKE